MVVIETGQLADRVYEAGAGRERPGAEGRARSLTNHTPILDAIGLAELPHGDLVAHGLPLTPLSARTSACYKTIYGAEADCPVPLENTNPFKAPDWRPPGENRSGSNPAHPP